jgi:hypothetical protein
VRALGNFPLFLKIPKPMPHQQMVRCRVDGHVESSLYNFTVIEYERQWEEVG